MKVNNIKMREIIDEMKKAVVGKDEVLEKILMAVLAGGHILIDDIPGVGKTTISRTLAKVLGLSQKRIQFTPDILPSDITGFSMYDKKTGEFHYMPGAAMTNILLADEINRTSPRTQSALLEVMEEGTVTVDSVTRRVPEPFITIATQNPLGFAGTQELPESQIDRFLIKLTLGYPSISEEIEILKGTYNDTEEQLKGILTVRELLELQQETKKIHVDDSIYEYIAKLAKATRESKYISLGVSPRGSIALINMAKARAMFFARSYVQPGDVLSSIQSVFSHRLLINGKAGLEHLSTEIILNKIVQAIPLPQITEQDK
ncbi:AAA family ATPase [Pectinatus sottacetonis]|uniref:AAA family ATPase n=1 Tax=Pectinatus sottacetonis TaxID=1002795 RepID=UPI0018C6EB37|nr:MoxR family ATPase [Pectinatus sottacetonis]